MKKTSLYVVLGLIVLQACMSMSQRNLYTDANKLMHESKNIKVKPFLKAHLKNGDLCVLNDTWKVDTEENVVWGKGTRYNFNRTPTLVGTILVPVDSVLIFETNTKVDNKNHGKIAALTILAGLDVSLGLFCATNPKACFGSCPTFYMNEKDNFHYADAEGFSDAISPSMEYGDIDALDAPKIKDKHFSLVMKNEALETHCVNNVKLYACPKNNSENIYQSSDNQFYLCDKKYTIKYAHGNEGDITTLLRNKDRMERYSLTDSKNIWTKEDVLLDFEGVDKNQDLGLVINFRQTLLTTYIFYSAMGYMGDQVSDVFAMLEKTPKNKNRFGKLGKLLGGIEIYVYDEMKQDWVIQGGFNETGPDH
ncbi:MAG: hypothetical protein HYZ42_18300 [Bacteroidetes bacterium]|nr:hypothetical protein [Bacteroidota bacterium]